MTPIEASFYDEAYFTDGTKSNYKPYGPGPWARWLTDMVVGHLAPQSVLDVGCAYGFIVDRLRRAGVDAVGFDISGYAIGQASHEIADFVWIGDASSKTAYVPAGDVDLVLATELPEHLTEDQADAFLRNALVVGQRALLLIAMHPDGEEVDLTHEKDLSHINIKPVSWWVSLAQGCGWLIDDAGPFNEDPRSSEMQWAGRFLLLRRPQ